MRQISGQIPVNIKLETKSEVKMGKREISREEAEKVLRENASKITEKDIEEVLRRQEEIERKLKGPLSRFFEDVKDFFSLLKDFFSGEYREVPWFTVAAITAALLYVLNPVDLIPDFIPIIGQVDDALVVSICLYLVEEDLEKYREWKRQRENA